MEDRFTTAREIAELNIEHYRRLLQTSLDEGTRATVEKLLAEEEAKLGRLSEGQPPLPGRCANR